MADSVNEVVEMEEKKVRKRTKKLYSRIRDQMEFYFSDSNLAKDKYLNGLMSTTEDGYIDIRVFLKFKKIRAMTTELKDIIKSLTSSELLEISEDELFIKRKTPIQIKENVDNCTVYVEGFSLQADHQWIQEIFEQFGKVAYVSIPRYKTGVVKGFAFVEFSNEDDAEKANKYFNPCEGVSDLRAKKSKSDASKAKERAKNESNVEENDEPAKKRIRMEDLEAKSTKDETTLEKKHRKKKKKNKEKSELDTGNLRVMTKKEWKRLRNKYLQLQRQNMIAVKKSLGLIRNDEKYSNANMVECCNPQKIETDVVEPVATKPPPEFVSGVIIQFETNEPVNNAKQYRAQLSGISGIVYIDLKDGHSVGNIRCDNAENVENILRDLEKKVAASFTVLKGEEEEEYWKQIFFDRENKLKNKSKPPTKIRGRSKIISKAANLVQMNNSHIRFDD